MVDIQSATAEIRRGKNKKKQDKNIMSASVIYFRFVDDVMFAHNRQDKKAPLIGHILSDSPGRNLICGPMPNVMVALPNIGGTLCSTPQFG